MKAESSFEERCESWEPWSSIKLESIFVLCFENSRWRRIHQKLLLLLQRLKPLLLRQEMDLKLRFQSQGVMSSLQLRLHLLGMLWLNLLSWPLPCRWSWPPLVRRRKLCWKRFRKFLHLWKREKVKRELQVWSKWCFWVWRHKDPFHRDQMWIWSRLLWSNWICYDM